MGEGGVQNGPKYSDVINEQPLIVIFSTGFPLKVNIGCGIIYGPPQKCGTKKYFLEKFSL